jgi:hypothetical protein
MIVVGIGGAGRAIASGFNKFPEYDVFLPEVGKFNTVEEYEQNCPMLEKKFEGVVWVIVSGASKESGMTLRLMEQFRHCEIKVAYIYPETMFLDDSSKKRNRVCFNVLQEYARSGLLDSIYLFCNKKMDEILDTACITNYYTSINEAITSVIHYYNYYGGVIPEFGKMREPKEISRIRAFGIHDLEKNEKKMFFPLDNITEKCYIINITEQDLLENKVILSQIKQKVKGDIDSSLNSSFVIFQTQHKANFCHTINYTHYIQSEDK